MPLQVLLVMNGVATRRPLVFFTNGFLSSGCLEFSELKIVLSVPNN